MTALNDNISESAFDAIIKSRTIHVAEGITDATYRYVANLLTVMETESQDAPIQVFVNSPGGSADSGFAIFDRLRFSSAPIITVANGIVASSAVMVFLGADNGSHFALPNARFLLHQPSTMARGQASDIDITAKEISKIREQYNKIVASHTGKSLAEVETDARRDFWLNAEEAQSYGLCSKIIAKRAEIG